MKQLRLFWLALLLCFGTGIGHATHLKGGSLTWEKVPSETGFKVRATVLVNYDLSDSGVLGGTGPEVDGRPTFVLGDSVKVITGSTLLHWGEFNASGMEYVSSLEGVDNAFTVVALDQAAQIVTVQATLPDLIEHTYTSSGTFAPYIEGVVRDHDEELANRTSTTMRIGSSLPVNLATPSGNRPPAFGADDPFLIIVPKSQPGMPVTFQAPTATDADGDIIRYRFVSTEAEATVGGSTVNDSSWEKQNLVSISPGGLITWDTALIEQTVQTYSIQVVAEDFATPQSVIAKSKTTVEFQVWVDDTSQTGVPTIAIEGGEDEFTVLPGQTLEVRLLGTDIHPVNGNENSRLTVVVPPAEMPATALIVPQVGFAGEEHPMEAVFSWTPAFAEAGVHVIHFRMQDEEGNLSDPVAVTINVKGLELVVTPGTDITVNYNTPVSFTVTGRCANPVRNMTLTLEEGTLPPSAALTPGPVVVSGSGTVQTTFDWTPPQVAVAQGPRVFVFKLEDADGLILTTTVTVTVVAPELVLTLDPAMPETLNAPLGTPIQFTVTGSCAASDMALVLAEDGGQLPASAQLLPAAAVGGYETVAIEFTWTPLPEDRRPAGTFLRFTLHDGVGRSRSTSLHVILPPPPAPTLALAAGLTPPLAGTYWQRSDFGVVATGGTSQFGALSLSSKPGTLSPVSGNSPLDATVSWTPVAADPSQGVTLQVSDQWNQTGTLFVPFSIPVPVAPLWWTPAEVLSPGAPVMDHGMANQGQFKALAKKAYDTLLAANTELDDGGSTDGLALAQYITGLSPTAHNYQPVSQGHVKHAAKLFYDVLRQVRNDPAIGYPWSPGTLDDAHFAAVTVGQLKSVFSFPIEPNALPQVGIASPFNGQDFSSPASVTIVADALDPDGQVTRVDFYQGSTLIGSDFNSPFSATWSGSTVGFYTFTAVAYDNDDGQSLPAMVGINVTPHVNQPPNSNVLWPANGATYNVPASFTIQAYDHDPDGTVAEVRFYESGNLIGVDTTSPFTLAWGSVRAGTLSLTSQAVDNEGLVGPMSAAVSVIVNHPGGSVTVPFRNGGLGYEGMVDTYIHSGTGSEINRGTEQTLLADGDTPDSSVLLRWDLSSIPPGKTVTAATITVNVTNHSGSQNFPLYAVRRTWGEEEATWTKATASVNWTTAGASNTTTDRENTSFVNFTAASLGSKTFTLNAAGRAKIQGWIADPATNKGFIIQHASNGNDLIFNSSEAAISARPVLNITYQ